MHAQDAATDGDAHRSDDLTRSRGLRRGNAAWGRRVCVIDVAWGQAGEACQKAIVDDSSGRALGGRAVAEANRLTTACALGDARVGRIEAARRTAVAQPEGEVDELAG